MIREEDIVRQEIEQGTRKVTSKEKSVASATCFGSKRDFLNQELHFLGCLKLSISKASHQGH